MVIMSMLMMMFFFIFIIVGGICLAIGIVFLTIWLFKLIREKKMSWLPFLAGGITFGIGILTFVLPIGGLMIFGSAGSYLRKAQINSYENQFHASSSSQWSLGFTIGDKDLVYVDGLIQNLKLPKEEYGVILYDNPQKNKTEVLKVYQVDASCGHCLYYIEGRSGMYCERQDETAVKMFYNDGESYRGTISWRDQNDNMHEEKVDASFSEVKAIRDLYDEKECDFWLESGQRGKHIHVLVQTEDEMAYTSVDLAIYDDVIVLEKASDTGIILDDYQTMLVNRWLEEAGY